VVVQIVADLPLELANQCVTRDTLKIPLRSALKIGVVIQCLTLSHIVMYFDMQIVSADGSSPGAPNSMKSSIGQIRRILTP